MLQAAYIFSYDALDRLATQDNAGTPTGPRVRFAFAYDAEGNLLSTADDTGVRVDNVYDNRHFLVSRTWQGGGIDPVRVDYDYNARGDLTGCRAVVRPLREEVGRGRHDPVTGSVAGRAGRARARRGGGWHG